MTVCAAPSASEAAGIEALDPLRLHAASLARGRQLAQVPLEPLQPLLLDERLERLVRIRLLGPETVRERGDARAVGRRHLGREAGQREDRDVAIAALAERVGDRLDLLEDARVAGLRKARREDLERCAQAARGDPHVVDAADLGHVEDALGVPHQLVGPRLDDQRRRLGERHPSGQALDLTLLRHRAPSL